MPRNKTYKKHYSRSKSNSSQSQKKPSVNAPLYI